MITTTLLSQTDKTYNQSRKLIGLANRLAKEQKRGKLNYYASQLEARCKSESDRLVLSHTKSPTPGDEEIIKLASMKRDDLLKKIWPEYNSPGRKRYSSMEKVIYDRLHEGTQNARVAQNRFLCTSEIVEKANRGWFIIFDTLTVDDANYSAVFSTGSPEFKNYIRRVQNRVAKDTFGSKRRAPADRREYHTYFAVCERGGRRGRWHIHVIHFCRNLACSDPNVRRTVPNRRELPCFKGYWPHGYSAPMPVRFIGDRWSKEGFIWPVQKASSTARFEPILAAPAMATGFYITKYLKKAFLDKQKGEYPWRVRRSRQLGTNLTRMILKDLTPEQAMTLLLAEPLRMRINNRTVIPTAIWKKITLEKALSYLPNRLQLRKECKPQRSHVQRLLDLIRKKQSHNLQKIGYMRTPIFVSTAEYDLDFVHDLRLKLKYVADTYFTQPEGMKRYGNQPKALIGIN
jgi:hypothetical protein